MLESCTSPGLTVDIAYRLSSCSGFHECDFAVYNLFINNTFKGTANLNNDIDAGERISSFFIPAEETSSLLKSNNGILDFGVYCALTVCHSSLPLVTITTETGNEVFNQCVRDETYSINLITLCGNGYTTTTTTTTTTLPPASTTTPVPSLTTTTTSPSFTTTLPPNPDTCTCDHTSLPPIIIFPPSPVSLSSVDTAPLDRTKAVSSPEYPLSSASPVTPTFTTIPPNNGGGGGGVPPLSCCDSSLPLDNRFPYTIRCFNHVLYHTDACRWSMVACSLFRPPPLVYKDNCGDTIPAFSIYLNASGCEAGLRVQTPPYQVYSWQDSEPWRGDYVDADYRRDVINSVDPFPYGIYNLVFDHYAGGYTGRPAPSTIMVTP